MRKAQNSSHKDKDLSSYGLDVLNTLPIRYCTLCNSIYFEEDEFPSHYSTCPHKGVLLFRVGNSFLKKKDNMNNKRFLFFLRCIY